MPGKEKNLCCDTWRKIAIMLKSLTLTILLILSSIVAAHASQPLELTVYQNGVALVNEVRSVELDAGHGELALSELPKALRFGTLLVESASAPKGFRALSTQFHPGGISSAALLERRIGSELEFVLPDSHDADSRRVVKAKLLGIEGSRALLELEDGTMWIGPYEAVMLESAPDGAVLKPVMNLRYGNSGPEKQNLALSYLTDGFDWNAEMVLKKKGDKYAMSGWATIVNRSGKAYDDARVLLVAGDVRASAPTNGRMMLKAAAMEADMAAAPMPQQNRFGQWHVYDAGKGFSLPDGASTRLALFEVQDMPVERRLFARGSVSLSPRGTVEQRPLDVQLVLRNQGTGMPLPSGVVRVYEPGPHGALLFAGESGIGNIPQKGKATLNLGRAFDVTMDRRQTEFSKTGKNRYTVAYEVTFRNVRPEAANVVLEERVPGQWNIVSASPKPEKKDAATLRYNLNVPGNQSVSVTYKLHIELR